jgi:protein TonB
MFETSVIQGQTPVAKSRLSVLTISILAHSAVIIGAVAVSIASVDFPRFAPDEFAHAPMFLPVLQIPPPLGNRNGGAQPQPATRPAAPPPQQPNQVTAPSVIPNDVPQVDAPLANRDGDANTDPNGQVPGPVGESWGVEGSVGPIGGPPVPMPAQPVVEERIYQSHEVTPPVGIYKPAPPYPQLMVKTRMSATVVIRCIIDKNGHVRDPQVIVPAPMAPFNDAVIHTVKTWRFTPGSVGGQAVESYLNLTVRFGVN